MKYFVNFNKFFVIFKFVKFYLINLSFIHFNDFSNNHHFNSLSNLTDLNYLIILKNESSQRYSFKLNCSS